MIFFFFFSCLGGNLVLNKKALRGEIHQGHYNCHLAVTNVFLKETVNTILLFLASSKGKLVMFWSQHWSAGFRNPL